MENYTGQMIPVFGDGCCIVSITQCSHELSTQVKKTWKNSGRRLFYLTGGMSSIKEEFETFHYKQWHEKIESLSKVRKVVYALWRLFEEGQVIDRSVLARMLPMITGTPEGELSTSDINNGYYYLAKGDCIQGEGSHKRLMGVPSEMLNDWEQRGIDLSIGACVASSDILMDTEEATHHVVAEATERVIERNNENRETLFDHPQPPAPSNHGGVVASTSEQQPKTTTKVESKTTDHLINLANAMREQMEFVLDTFAGFEKSMGELRTDVTELRTMKQEMMVGIGIHPLLIKLGERINMLEPAQVKALETVIESLLVFKEATNTTTPKKAVNS